MNYRARQHAAGRLHFRRGTIYPIIGPSFLFSRDGSPTRIAETLRGSRSVLLSAR